MARSRKSTTALTKLLDAGVIPIYALDDQRRIIYLNAACRNWLGNPEPTPLGMVCNYQFPLSSGNIEKTVSGLSPPPEVFAGISSSGQVSALRNDGEVIQRRGQFIPLLADDGSVAGALAILQGEDIQAADVACSRPQTHTFDDLHQRLHAVLWANRDAVAVAVLAGESDVARRLRRQFRLAKNTVENVLIEGPVGSGRHHLARAIHYAHTGGPIGPIVPLACGHLSPELVLSTIDALDEAAKSNSVQGAALLLRDLDRLPAEMEWELARRIESNKMSYRVMATVQASREGERPTPETLLRAVSTLTIRFPPLASRQADLPLIAQSILEELNDGEEKQFSGFEHDAVNLICGYSWPAEMKELVSVIREARIQCAGPQISANDLPPKLKIAASVSAHRDRRPQPIDLTEYLAHVERMLVSRALDLATGNKTRAARLLGLTRPRLYRRMVQLGLEAESKPEDDKPDSQE